MAAKTGHGNTPPRMVRVEDELWEAAKAEAARVGTTVSAVIRDALRAFVANKQTRQERPQ